MREEGRVIPQTPAETHRVTGIVGLQIDNAQARRVRAN